VNELTWNFHPALEETGSALPPEAPAARHIGPFAVEGELGRGGMGQVFRVRYRGELYALKILLREARAARLQREARLVADLDHPGIVALRGTGRVEGRPFVLYELVPRARTLREAWDESAPQRRVELVLEAAEAVGYAHAQGVVHRDLKPANILVDPSGVVRVIDFGLATHEDVDRLTRTGAWLGTPEYMAPEQFAAEQVSQRPQVDVWALGVLLYQALTGVTPFQAETVLGLVAKLQAGSFRRPRELAPEVPPAVEAVCLRALRLEQDQRPADARAFAAALRDALHQGWRPGRRAPSVGLLAALGALGLALGAAAWASWGTGADPAPAAEPVALGDPFALIVEDGVSGAELLALARARLAEDPDDLEARAAEATAQMELGDYEAALLLARAVLVEDPGQPAALRVEVGSNYELGRGDAAQAAAERLLEHDPRSLVGLTYMSLIASQERDPERALDYAQRALEVDPESHEAYGARGMARMGLQQPELALEDFDRALLGDDGMGWTYFNRATALLLLRRYDAALADLERVEGELREHYDWAFVRLRCLVESGDPLAEEEGRALAERAPEKAGVAFVLGELLRRERRAECRDWYRRAVELEPDSLWGRLARDRLQRLQ